MVKVTYIENNGTVHVVDGEPGQTVMETAIKHAVPGIVAECAPFHSFDPAALQQSAWVRAYNERFNVSRKVVAFKIASFDFTIGVGISSQPVLDNATRGAGLVLSTGCEI